MTLFECLGGIATIVCGLVTAYVFGWASASSSAPPAGRVEFVPPPRWSRLPFSHRLGNGAWALFWNPGHWMAGFEAWPGCFAVAIGPLLYVWTTGVPE